MTHPVWLNDRFVAAEEARIDPADRGFMLADGCFDTALCVDGKVFRADHHLDRLAATCVTLGLPIARERLATAQDSLARQIGSGSVRLTVTRGTGARGLTMPQETNPTLLGTISPLASHLMFKPLRLALAETRRNETSLTARHKTLAYLDAIVESDRAKRSGVDEPLFLNMMGRIACGALGNIIEITSHDCVTPPLEDGVLDGVMRRFLLEAMPLAGHELRIASLLSDDCRDRHFLLTNSLRLIAPAFFVDGPSFGVQEATRTRALMEHVCTAIQDECGTDPRDLGAAFPELIP